MSALTLLPFAQVPGEILMDDRLKPTHIRVLIALYMHKNKKRKEKAEISDEQSGNEIAPGYWRQGANEERE